jgi:hypothetical protein
MLKAPVGMGGKARKAGVRAVVLMYDSPDGYLGYLSNPQLNDLLRGGQRKVIDFTRNFDRALTDLLLVLAPEIGQQRAPRQVPTTFTERLAPGSAGI